jgi:CheY-like chemotaxis protein
MNATKVMIADSNIEFTRMLKRTLQLGGYRTFAIFDGFKIRNMACLWKPDAIILNLMIMGAGGRPVAEELRSFPETIDIPIIAISDHNDADNRWVYKERCRLETYLEKPFCPLDVIFQIEKVVGDRRTVRRSRFTFARELEDAMNAEDVTSIYYRYLASLI